MNDVTQTTEPTTTGTSTEPTSQTTPLPNDPAARTPSGELKDASAAAETKPAEKPEEKPAAPETYEKFKVAEGREFSDELFGKASGLFKELGLSQDAAQKLVDFYGDIDKAATEKLSDVVTEMRLDWRNKVQADPVIGGTKLEGVLAEIGKAKAQLPADVRTALDEAFTSTGMGDHPALVRGFYELAKLVNEGPLVKGGGPSEAGQQKPGDDKVIGAKALYPNLA